mmetsp:Transcript_25099/g.63847  ORF Transcript_25099/g.63847 Transcript_25099/m.63847 type:complete len:261 (+) Transcript_25099:133-915(+)
MSMALSNTRHRRGAIGLVELSKVGVALHELQPDGVCRTPWRAHASGADGGGGGSSGSSAGRAASAAGGSARDLQGLQLAFEAFPPGLADMSYEGTFVLRAELMQALRSGRLRELQGELEAETGTTFIVDPKDNVLSIEGPLLSVYAAHFGLLAKGGALLLGGRRELLQEGPAHEARARRKMPEVHTDRPPAPNVITVVPPASAAAATEEAGAPRCGKEASGGKQAKPRNWSRPWHTASSKSPCSGKQRISKARAPLGLTA